MRNRIVAVMVLLFAPISVSAAEPVDPAKSVEAARQAVATLQSQLEALAGALAEREKAIKAKEAADGERTKELAELRSEVTAIRQAMTEQKQAVDRSGADVERLERENKELRAKLEQAAKAGSAASEARDSLTALERENKELKAKLEQAAKAGTDASEARENANALASEVDARGKQIEQLQAALAESQQQMAALRQVAEAAAKAVGASVGAAPQPIGEVGTSASAPTEAAVAIAPSAQPAPGGIKQWRQPDGKLFFGENPPVPGSKLIGVIGAPGGSSE